MAEKPSYEELEQRVQKLERIEEKLLWKKAFSDAMIASLPGIFYVFNEHGKFLQWNDNLEITSEYSFDEIAQMHPEELFSTSDRARVNEAIMEVFVNGLFSIEVNILSKHGISTPHLLTGARFDVKGTLNLVGIGVNLTETKRLQDQLLQAQKMEAIGTLAGGIAHDFNNILGAILGYAELAQTNSRDNPKVQRYIDQLCIASQRAKDLVQQILAFSRQSKSEKTPVDIGIVVKEALKLLRASIPTTIEIRQDVKLNLGTVEANQTQIHQIIMNLCTNAFHAMEKEGGQLDVDLIPVKISIGDSSIYRDLKPGQYLKLTITDTGHGMSADVISHIFEPYFTKRNAGEGTGMGLATVHGIVKNHRGAITVYSEPDTGTSFNVLLPLIKSCAEKKTEILDILPTGTEQILFVDDEKFLVDIGKELLEDLGYKVEAMNSSIDALDVFRSQPYKYDMVITDLTMPKMTGEKLAEKIKKIRPDIPIILCTGFSMRITHENIKEKGINSLLMKPLTIHELSNTIRGILDGE